MLSICFHILELIKKFVCWYHPYQKQLFEIDEVKFHISAIKSLVLDGWMGGWVDGRASLRIAYSNKKNSTGKAVGA